MKGRMLNASDSGTTTTTTKNYNLLTLLMFVPRGRE